MKAQRPDGSWFGSWAVCFTYAMMFALESLHLAGQSCENSEPVRRACNFLLGKQREDGGWGEDFKVSRRNATRMESHLQGSLLTYHARISLAWKANMFRQLRLRLSRRLGPSSLFYTLAVNIKMRFAEESLSS